MRKLEEQLREQVEELLRMAEEADGSESGDGLDIPAELERREQRLKAIEEAKAQLAQRVAEREAAEKAEYEAKTARREAQRKKGKKPRGPEPKPPQGGIRDKDQINLTDEESRIMPVSGGGFEQAYNAQAVVENDSRLIVVSHVTQNVNDKREMEPALRALEELPPSLGRPVELLADNGYYSESNVELCGAEEVVPYISVDREPHYWGLRERGKEPEPPGAQANAVEQMKYRLKTSSGRAIYAQRKSTVEPVFGVIKSVMGFRQFLLRGVQAVEGEWDLVSIAWNLKRMHKLWSNQQALSAVGS